ncbi:MAG: hypothetical protein L3J38_07545 [Thiomicrorhabdus sp.]|nr:hypothetical protein [Thiomicrorhabdus sp.]
MYLKVEKMVLGVLVGVFLSLSLATQASAYGATDDREIIWVTEKEKALLLSEMRAFLSASQKILEANLVGDMKAVEEAARLVGVSLFKNTPEAIHEKLPITFSMIGPRAYMGFESIVNEATGGGDMMIIFSQLAELQKNCVACHSLFRFKVKE